MSKPDPESPALPREEWDFSKVVEDELEACLRYEMAREVQDYLSYFLVDDEAARDREGAREDREGDPDALSPEEEWMYIGVMFCDMSGGERNMVPVAFPELAWQRMPAWFREQLASTTQAKSTGVELLNSSFSFLTAQERRLEKMQGKQSLEVRINWNQSNASLMDDFRLWLEENRPKDMPGEMQRGRLSMRDDLNALGALRLRHHYSAAEALEVTRPVLGSPLYSKAYSFDRAAVKALTLFKEMFPGAKGPVSGKMKAARRGRPAAFTKATTMREA